MLDRKPIIMQRELPIIYTRKAATFAWARDIIAHSYRLMGPAQAIAYLLGLSQDEVNRVGLAAFVHDLGKFAIPTAILYKPGPLTEEEWIIIRHHPEFGCQMLLHAGGDWASLAPLVLAHHERWDGSGYPFGLAKKAIALEARILSVVDSYDAMISARVYRKPLTHKEARAELQRCAGHQFDPEVVAAFLPVLDAQERLQAYVSSIETMKKQGAPLDGSVPAPCRTNCGNTAITTEENASSARSQRVSGSRRIGSRCPGHDRWAGVHCPGQSAGRSALWLPAPGVGWSAIGMLAPRAVSQAPSPP